MLWGYWSYKSFVVPFYAYDNFFKIKTTFVILNKIIFCKKKLVNYQREK